MSGLCERCGDNQAALNDEWCHDCILEVELMLAEAEEPVELPIERNYYTLEDLERRVAEFEDEYGLPSDVLMELHYMDRAPFAIPGFDRHVWLSYYREILESKPWPKS